MAHARKSRSGRAKLGVAAGAVSLALAPAILAPGVASAQDFTGSAETVLESLIESIDFADLITALLGSGSAEAPA